MDRRLHHIWTAKGWLYVAAVVDLFSRQVAGWSMSATMTARCGGRGKPVMHRSDVAGQYTCKPFQRLMAEHGDRDAR